MRTKTKNVIEKELKQKQGITLISLVITIIVLLILAGVTISILTGDNGLLQKTTNAKQENEYAQEEEKVKLAVSSAKLEGYGSLEAQNLNSELQSIFNNNNEVTRIDDGWIYEASRRYIIYDDGNVEWEGLLTYEYKEIEYIETTGSQYIDTEYVFKNKPKITGDIMITSTGDYDVMGTNVNENGCFILDFINGKLYYRYSTTSYTIINLGISVNEWYNFEFSDKVKVNGIEQYSTNSYDFSNNNRSFHIGGGRNCGYAKFKKIKMYDGDELVRDLIPCYRRSDYKRGMYDLLNKKFYTNQNSGDFYYDDRKNLNEDCELEYIEAVGQQYIDTGYVFKNKPKVLGDIMMTVAFTRDIIGNATSKDGCFIVYFNNSRLEYSYSTSNYTAFNVGINNTEWNNFEFSDKVIVNGTEKGSINSYDFSNNDQSFYIGRGRNNAYAKYKEIKMYDGDDLVRDLIPYYQKSTDKVGMYDKVNKIFYGSQTSNDFIAGPKK